MRSKRAHMIVHTADSHTFKKMGLFLAVICSPIWLYCTIKTIFYSNTSSYKFKVEYSIFSKKCCYTNGRRGTSAGMRLLYWLQWCLLFKASFPLGFEKFYNYVVQNCVLGPHFVDRNKQQRRINDFPKDYRTSYSTHAEETRGLLSAISNN